MAFLSLLQTELHAKEQYVDGNIAPTAAAEILLFVPRANHKDIKYVVLANNCLHTQFTCHKSNIDLTTDN